MTGRNAGRRGGWEPILIRIFLVTVLRIFIGVVWLWVSCAIGISAPTQAGSDLGPLQVLSANPRYFTDGSGRAVYLAGSHNWHNFQDNGHRLPEGQDPTHLLRCQSLNSE
jgi:hypothetical protein